jgi:hypothetical protein
VTTRCGAVACCLPACLPACLDQRSRWIDPNPSIIPRSASPAGRPPHMHSHKSERSRPGSIMEVASPRLGRDGRTHASADCRGGRGIRSGSPRPAAGAGGPAPGDTRAQRLCSLAARRPIHYRPSPLSLPPMPPEMQYLASLSPSLHPSRDQQYSISMMQRRALLHYLYACMRPRWISSIPLVTNNTPSP